ncbi:RNA polymerase sigma factor [Stieleria neptunia]|nr:sigma-70 family RNA polymerase sigma factor [Stieleria neptunia]
MNRTNQTDELTTDRNSAVALEQFCDAELLDAWSRDQLAAALTVLVTRHARMVLTVCRRKCRSAADADDAFQTTFLVLAKNSAKITRPDCLAGWLHRVAHRASVATLAGKHRSPEPMIEQVLIDDPLDRITQQHDAIVLDEELAGLPEHYRAALVMQVYEDCPLERMAEHFQTSLGSIRGRLQRGKKLLADRLRRRGVVPLLAFAAAGSITVTADEVSAAGTTFLSTVADGPLPSPPIQENLLHPLVASGKRIMTPWNVAGGLTAIGTIATLLLVSAVGADGGPQSSPSTPSNTPITLRAEPDAIAGQFAAPAETRPQDQAGQTPATGAMGFEGPDGTGVEFTPSTAETVGSANPSPDTQTPETQTVLRRRFRPASPSGKLADSLAEMMDEQVELQITGALDSLVDQLQDQIQQPVILSPRVTEYAQLEPGSPVKYRSRPEPLRTALRKLLQPLGLKATIESEGLVITADHSELVHRGIGTDQWLSVNDAMMRQAEEKLAKTNSVAFVETPLAEAVSQLSQTLDLPIVIDKRSLEDIGIDADVPVDADVYPLSGYDLISLILRQHDLVLTAKDNLLTVVADDIDSRYLLGRVYWLEGIGIGGDFDSLMDLMETTINPDTWEAMGGASTMSPAPGNRPGLVVSTTYQTHRQIEQLLQTLRENSFGLDAVAEEVEVAIPVYQTGFGGAVGGGGGGFGVQGGGFM